MITIHFTLTSKMWLWCLILIISNLNFSYGTITLFANISDVANHSVEARIEAQCVTDDYNNAIIWITPLHSQLDESVTDTKLLTEVQFNWLSDGWGIEDSYHGMFGPILDYFWESFPTLKTNATESQSVYNFIKLNSLKFIDQFELNFSFKGKSCLIYLCTNNTIIDSACYIFDLGDEKDAFIVKKCKQFATPVRRNSTWDGCDYLAANDGFPFSMDIWSQISLKFLNLEFQIIINNDTILSYIVQDSNEFMNYTQLFVHSNTDNALWKYHDYTYYEARNTQIDSIISTLFYTPGNQLCLSFFAKFEKEMTLRLYDIDGNILKEVKYTNENDQTDQWNYKTFSTVLNANTKSNQYFVSIIYNPEDLLAIRNFVIQEQCEVINTHSSKLVYEGNVSNITCSNLKSQQVQIGFKNLNSIKQLCSEQKHSEQYVDNETDFSYRIVCHEVQCQCLKDYYGEYYVEEKNSAQFVSDKIIALSVCGILVLLIGYSYIFLKPKNYIGIHQDTSRI